MKKRFGILRLIGSIYKILGIIVAVITLLGAIAVCATSVLGGAALEQFMGNVQQYGDVLQPGRGPWGMMGGMAGGLIGGVGIILSGLATAIGLYAAGELIYLLLSLEENTRVTARLLEHTGEPEE